MYKPFKHLHDSNLNNLAYNLVFAKKKIIIQRTTIHKICQKYKVIEMLKSNKN